MSAPKPSSTLDRIRAHEARVGVVGLGYVGLPLAVEFAHVGFAVTGFDVDRRQADQINAGRSDRPDVPEADLSACVQAGKLRATTDMRQSGAMDAIDICVPTPLGKPKDPDLSYVVHAVEAVAATLRRGQLVILESTTSPGTTDEEAQPMLAAKGLEAEVDFFLAFSPERVDPGNQQFTTKNIPKTVRGVGPTSTEVSGPDPYVPQLTQTEGKVLSSIDLAPALASRPACAVICSDHAVFDYQAIVNSGTQPVDTRNVLLRFTRPKILRSSDERSRSRRCHGARRIQRDSWHEHEAARRPEQAMTPFGTFRIALVRDRREGWHVVCEQ